MKSFFDCFESLANGGSLQLFASGALMMTCLATATFFLRFWRQTRDRLFLIFAMAFAMMGLERFSLAYFPSGREDIAPAYVVRLTAFILIIVAILDKNRASRR